MTNPPAINPTAEIASRGRPATGTTEIAVPDFIAAAGGAAIGLSHGCTLRITLAIHTCNDCQQKNYSLFHNA